MKIQVIKKSGAKTPSSSQCTWFIEDIMGGSPTK